MKCSDRVGDFVKRHSIEAVLKRFSDTVETVEKAAKLCSAKPSDIVKTLVLIAGSQPVVAVIPGDRRLNYRKLNNILNVKSVRMAKPDEVKEYLGFEIGGVSPLSECLNRYTVIVDREVVSKSYIWCGGGDIYTLAYVKTQDLIRVLNPLIADISDPMS